MPVCISSSADAKNNSPEYDVKKEEHKPWKLFAVKGKNITPSNYPQYFKAVRLNGHWITEPDYSRNKWEKYAVSAGCADFFRCIDCKKWSVCIAQMLNEYIVKGMEKHKRTLQTQYPAIYRDVLHILGSDHEASAIRPVSSLMVPRGRQSTAVVPLPYEIKTFPGGLEDRQKGREEALRQIQSRPKHMPTQVMQFYPETPGPGRPGLVRKWTGSTLVSIPAAESSNRPDAITVTPNISRASTLLNLH